MLADREAVTGRLSVLWGVPAVERFNTPPRLQPVVKPTRRFWEAFGVAAALAAVAVVAARPLLLVPAGVVLAWLLAIQVGFVHALGRLDDSLDVEQWFDREATVVDAPTTLSVSTTGDVGTLDVHVEVRPAAGLVVGRDAVGFGDVEHVTVTSPVAGRHLVEPPELVVGDPAGMFVERLCRGDEASLRVDARRAERLHVGQGGEERMVAFGEHPSEQFGSGPVPAEIREYVPEESAGMIDWRTTARLGEPYVRKYEAETDVVTVIVLDARSGLDVGPAGETAMDYLRAAALSYLTAASARGDPVGVLGVEDDGVRRIAGASTATRVYERARAAITDATAGSGEHVRRRAPPLSARSGAIDTDSRFGRTLAAYAGSRTTDARTGDPLGEAVRSAVGTHPGTVQLAVFTDDTDRAAIRRAIADARPRHNPVAVFLAPRVLYEPGGLADVSRAAQVYRGFERFRRDVAAIEGTRAFEVAPRDRLETVMAADELA